jgi:Rieske Fe-S protein
MRHDPETGTIPPDGRPLAEQPRWRRDFPIDWPRDEYVSRRDFTRFLALTSLAFFVGQLWILLQNAWRTRRGTLPIVAVARVDDMARGSAKLFSYPDAESHAILVRLADGEFVAYDQQCTHLLCPVIAQPEHGRLHCPCHNGNFDLATGRVLSGPPQRPLPRIALDIRGATVYATGMAAADA